MNNLENWNSGGSTSTQSSSVETNTTQEATLSPEEKLKQIKEKIKETIDSLPPTAHLVDIYQRSFSVDHYHPERAEEVSKLMVLRAKLTSMLDHMNRYINSNDEDFQYFLISPSFNSQELKDLLKSKNGKDFLDADTHKIFELINSLETMKS